MSENKYCGNCYYFSNEDIGGEGLCGFPLSPFVTLCGKKGCKNHVFRKKQAKNNGWTEITPDNVDEVYRIDHDRIIIGWLDSRNSTFATTFNRCTFTPNDMAKYGGYYYYVLPELKKEESK